MDLHFLIPSFSLAIQLVSLVLAIRLMRDTEDRGVGIVFVLIVFLMSFRRVISLFRYFSHGPIGIDVFAESVALAISLLILCGIVLISRFLKSAKRAKTAAALAEMRYRTLFEQSPDGVLLMNMKGEVVDFNNAVHRQLGYSREEFSNMRISDIDPVENEEDVKASFAKLLEKGQAQFEVKHVTKQGDVRDVLVITKRIELSGEIFFHTIWRDISEGKRAEKALTESEDRFRSIFNEATDGIMIADIETTRQLEANKAMCRMLGYTREELIGLKMEDIHPEESLPVIRERFEKQRQGEISLAAGIPMRRKNGSVFYADINATGVTLGGKNCLLGIFRDITERKKLEAQLLQAQKLESIGTLAGGIAHDFNNLLQGIFGYISMAKKNIEKKEESLAMLTQAEEALHLSVNLTNQLLTFSKGGKPVKKLIKPEPVVERAVKFALSGSSTNYEMVAPGELRAVEADEGQLSQVIQNIVLNANEAMSGHGTVSVSLSNVDSPEDDIDTLTDGGPFVHIDIQDSGLGIPEQNLARVFDPYFSTKQKGSGLGLATSYSIIKNHGGTVKVASTAGKGTTFSIYLPASIEGIPKEAVHPGNLSGTRKGKILLMDDEEMVRSVAKSMIEVLGHEVDTVPDGAKALELFEQAWESDTPYDLVILDLTVKGGMGGEEAIRKIRKIDPKVAAVVSSGYADSSAMANYQAHGFTATLDKPYMIESLQSCIEQLLK